MSLSVQDRLKLIKAVEAGVKTVEQACKEAGIARKSFYKWYKRYKKASPINKLSKPQHKQRKSSVHSNKTHAYKKGKDKKVWTAKERLLLFESTIKDGVKIADACRKFGISRKTYYKWYKRYQEKKELNVDTFKEKEWRIINHPRRIHPEIEDKIMSLVIEKPELSSHKIAQALNIGNHGVQNILERRSLNIYKARLAYSQSQRPTVEVPAPVTWVDRVRYVLEQFVPSLAPAPPPTLTKVVKVFSAFSLISLFIFLGSIYWINLFKGQSLSIIIGLIFATSAIFMGSLFFLYSLKYYITLALVLSFSQQEADSLGKEGGRRRGILSWILGITNGNGNGNGNGKKGRVGPVGLEPNLEHISLKKHPFISVHIPFYNEKNVVERAMVAATSFEYQGEYEVILCDDSTDETTDIIRRYQKKHLLKGEKLKKIVNQKEGWELTEVEVKPGVYLKHLHRTTRSGFKGGALKLALTQVNPKTEFISVFDADFVPYPDTLELFLKYFKVQNNMSEDYKKSNVAAVQGYQWHVLNKSENWITRGVRSEYAGSYVIERSGREIYGALKQISGAVYLLRRDVLEEVGWASSITEDFELTLKIYNAGYKIVFTPYIQAPAECVSTIKRLIRQRMRWAEGHSNNIRKMFIPLMTNPKLTISEKAELLYLSPYYLQAFFFLVGTFSWLISETLFPARLPFWTSLWGWSLVLTNLLSLPLVNAVGLFLEESEEKDYAGLVSFIALSYIVVPFQAYASVKGFLIGEGPWFRTPKTGKVTDILKRGTFYRFISGILPGRSSRPAIEREESLSFLNKYAALATANSQFNSFAIKPKKIRWVGKAAVSLVLVISLSLSFLTTTVPEREPPSSPFRLSMPSFDLDLNDHSSAKPLELVGEKTNFGLDEHPEFIIQVENKETDEKLSFIKPKPVYAQEEEIVRTEVFYIGGDEKRVNLPVDVSQDEGGQYIAKLYPHESGFRPGKYRLEATFGQGDEKYWGTQDFTWGVLAINTNKSIYLTDEEASIGMAVLDDEGHTICDAQMELKVKNPNLKVEKVFTTKDGTIQRSHECGPITVTNKPDYSATYNVSVKGTYVLKLIAETENGVREIEDSFEVRESVPFEVERYGPTRIFPWAEYGMKLKVKVNQDFKGQVVEKVPGNFEFVGDQVFSVEWLKEERIQELVWEVNWKKGKTYELKYSFDPPNFSPQFYLLGPLEFIASPSAGSEQSVFTEARFWQIASDAEVSISTTVYDGDDEYNPGPAIVFISDQVGYVFNQQNGAYSYSSWSYYKTSNGGTSWSGPTFIEDAAQQTPRSWSVWYDQWTPGNSGTLIHLVSNAYDAGDMTQYNYLDTADDSTGSWVDVDTSMGAHNAPDGGGFVTVSTDGNIFAGSFAGTIGEIAKYVSSWTDITPGYLFNDDDDHAQVLPLSTGDILVIYEDSTANTIYSMVYDEGTDTWDGSATSITTLTSATTNGVEDANWGAVLDPSTFNVYLVLNNDVAAATGDIETWLFTDSSRTWGQQTNVITDTTAYNVKPAWDSNNDDLYAIYVTGVDVYYKSSTNGGTSWGSANQLNTANPPSGNWVAVKTNFYSALRLYAIYIEYSGAANADDMYGNTVAVVPEYTWIFFGLGPLLPGFIGKIRKRRRK